jgi:hypothetical protein
MEITLRAGQSMYPGRGEENFLFFKMSRRAFGPSQLPIQRIPGFIPEDKAVRAWNKSSLPSRAKVKKECNCNSIPSRRGQVKASLLSSNLIYFDMDMSYTKVLHIKFAYRILHKWRHVFYVILPLLCARITCCVTVITHGRCYARA